MTKIVKHISSFGTAAIFTDIVAIGESHCQFRGNSVRVLKHDCVRSRIKTALIVFQTKSEPRLKFKRFIKSHTCIRSIQVVSITTYEFFVIEIGIPLRPSIVTLIFH